MVNVDDDLHRAMDGDGVPRIGILLAPERVPPDWPGGDPSQQEHLDLWVGELSAAHD